LNKLVDAFYEITIDEFSEKYTGCIDMSTRVLGTCYDMFSSDAEHQEIKSVVSEVAKEYGFSEACIRLDGIEYPAIALLEHAEDFPKEGPILIITDGYCERLRISRKHTFIIPKSNQLPFLPRGQVFRIE